MEMQKRKRYQKKRRWMPKKDEDVEIKGGTLNKRWGWIDSGLKKIRGSTKKDGDTEKKVGRQ